MHFTLLSIAWLTGIVVAGLGFLPPSPFLLVLLLPMAAALLITAKKGIRKTRFVSLMVVLSIIGYLRYEQHAAERSRDELVSFRDTESVILRGSVASLPETRDTSTRWLLQVEQLRANRADAWEPRSGLVQVYSRWQQPIEYGEVLELTGKMATPPKLDGFDYQEYLGRQGVHSTMRYPQITRAGQASRLSILAPLFKIRESVAGILQQSIPEPESALAQGILLGIRGAIPQHILDDFKRTGTTHILAISGHNLSVMLGLFVISGGWIVGRRHTVFLLAVFVGLWTYAVLAALSPSVVRAALMASFLIGGILAGRPTDAFVSLGAAGFLMTLVDPYLIHDIGFQLSFLAMIGLVASAPLYSAAEGYVRSRRTEAQGKLWPAAQFVGANAAATLGATAFTIPVIALNFQVLPLAALPATLFGLPALTVILLGALATALIGALFPFAAVIPATVTWLASKYLILVVALWARVPAASLQTPAIAAAWGWVYMAVAGVFAFLVWRWSRAGETPSVALGAPLEVRLLPQLFREKRALGVRGALVALVVCTAIVWLPLLIHPEEELRVNFFDVGQGDATLLETSGGYRVLIDGGPSPTALLNQLDAMIPPWDRRIDLVMLTHPQRDHISGLLAVLSRYRVAAAAESGFPVETADYKEWRRLLQEKRVPSSKLQAGSTVQLPGVKMTVLHPRERDLLGLTPDQANDASLVLQVAAFGQRLLLTGDIEERDERALLRYREALGSSVLKVPHHGSKTSTSEYFLDRVSPGVAVIEVGAGNQFGHPHEEVLDRLRCALVLRTDVHGTIRASVRQTGMRIWPSRIDDKLTQYALSPPSCP